MADPIYIKDLQNADVALPTDEFVIDEATLGSRRLAYGELKTQLGTELGAAPTGSAGLTAVAGTAKTFLRSDGSQPISQAIGPTWTGKHTFNQEPAVKAPTATPTHVLVTTTDPNATAQDIKSATVASLSSVIGPPAAANPSASVGLTMVPGVATTVMRSDAAPPISQAILPTWTGKHVFSGGEDVTAVAATAPTHVAVFSADPNATPRALQSRPIATVLADGQFPVSYSPNTFTVGPGSRFSATGTTLAYAGGTLAGPGSDGVRWLVHTGANALALVTAYPPGTVDQFVLARVSTTSGVTTFVAPLAKGGDMLKANNLGDLANVATSRDNLGVSFGYTVGTTITGAGDTALVIAAANTDGVYRYAVTATAVAYTRTISVASSAGAPVGSKVTILLDMPAQAVTPPTIEIRNGTAGGTLLATAIAGVFARTERIELVWTASAWILVSAGPEPHAGFQSLAELANNSVPSGAIKFDGTLGKGAQCSVRGVTIGTGDYSAVCTFRVTNNPDAALLMGLFTIGGTAAGAVQAGSVMVWVQPASTTFNFCTRDGSGPTNATINFTPYLNRTIQLGVIRRAGVMSIFVDGSPLSFTPPTAQAQAMTDTDTHCFVGNVSIGSNNSYRERIHTFRLYNRALTGGELRALAARGVAVEDRDAKAVYQSNFTAGVDGWLGYTGGGSNPVLTREPGPISGLSDLLKIQGHSAGTFTFITRPGGIPRGRWVRMTALAYLPASNSQMNGCGVKINNQLTGAINTVKDAWTFLTMEGIDSEIAVGGNSSLEVDTFSNGALSYTGNGTDVLYLRDIVASSVGCLVDLDLGLGSGFVLPDMQNRFPLVISSGSFSNFTHVRQSMSGRFQAFINTTTPTLIGGLPQNARIMAVVFIPAAPVSARLGYASGGIELIAITPLEIGRNEPPLKTRYTSATGQIWVTLSAAVATDIVVIYDVLPGLTTLGAGDNLPMGEQIGYLEVFSAADQPIGATETTLAFATAGSSAGNGIALVGGNTIRVTRPGRIEFTVQLQMAHTNTTTTNVWLTQSNPTSSPVNEMGITIQGVASTERPSTFTGRIVSVASVANPIDYQIHAKSLATGTSLNFRSDVDNSPGSSSPAIKVLVALYKN